MRAKETDPLLSHPSPLPFHAPHLRKLSVPKPFQPAHARGRLAVGGGLPGHHDGRPPGKAFDLPPDQFSNSKALAVLRVKQKQGEG